MKAKRTTTKKYQLWCPGYSLCYTNRTFRQHTRPVANTKYYSMDGVFTVPIASCHGKCDSCNFLMVSWLSEVGQMCFLIVNPCSASIYSDMPFTWHVIPCPSTFFDLERKSEMKPSKAVWILKIWVHGAFFYWNIQKYIFCVSSQRLTHKHTKKCVKTRKEIFNTETSLFIHTYTVDS